MIATASINSHAAGLGRLEVKSVLGNPFRAEIAVLAEKNEIGSLSARMASQTAFQNAGLVLSSAISEMRVSIEKRANGEPYVSITSKQPLNEPVVDLLVELVWASGRVTREYTAFLDPPFIIAEREKRHAAAAAAAGAAAETKPQTQAVTTPPTPQPEPLPEAPPAAAETVAAPSTPAPTVPSGPVKTIGGTQPTLLSATQAPAPTAVTSAAEAPAGESYGPVKRGDYLIKIARANMPSEITLEQMLVLLFRNNPDAFVAKNMNRLKTGKILRLPSQGQYASVTPTEARREFVLQARDWNAYRERLAAASAAEAPPEVEPTQQAAAGPITPKVVEKPAGETQPPKEVLKLSKGQTAAGAEGTGAGQGRLRALEEEVVARDKAVKESSERVARLEKTIKDLQSLLEVKNQGMAEMQKQAAGAAAPAAPSAPKPAPGAPATAPPHAAAPAVPATPAQSASPAPKPEMRPDAPAHAPSRGEGAPVGQAAPRPAAPPAQPPRPRPA
ncbi:MAG: type IV pilus assembly protein FimV, partial [Burkholderiales bacterium]